MGGSPNQHDISSAEAINKQVADRAHIWRGGSLETFSREAQLKKSPGMNICNHTTF